tara:strand:+ start:977 stop:1300 length:324 start_codon:yes stop_codon:yes gene_type:complete
MMIKEIDVDVLKEKLSNNDDFILLDVRTDSEYYLSRIKGSIHIPMQLVPQKLDDLDKNKEIIVQCKSGKRSAKVCEFLLNNNFKNVKNLAGGILDWAKKIDPYITVY